MTAKGDTTPGPGAPQAPGRASAYRLRAGLRGVTERRAVRGCGRTAWTEEPAVVVVAGADGRAPSAHWHGLATCHASMCPVCAGTLAAKRMDAARRAIEGSGGRWQMLTLTLRHTARDDPKQLVDEILGAWRRCRATRAVRAIFDARVTASIRALEVTHGRHGWHPHIHLVLRTTDWTDDERETLRRAWRSALGTERVVPDDYPYPDPSVAWSEAHEGADAAFVARYTAKLGLEVSGLGAGKPGSMWRVAEDAVRGSVRAIAAWRALERAMRARQWFCLDARAKDYADTVPEEPAPEELARVHVYREAVRELQRTEDADPEDPERWLAIIAASRPNGMTWEAWVTGALDAAVRGSRAGWGVQPSVARWLALGLAPGDESLVVGARADELREHALDAREPLVAPRSFA